MTINSQLLLKGLQKTSPSNKRRILSAKNFSNKCRGVYSNNQYGMQEKIKNKKLSSTCEEFKFRGWYDAAFRLGQETHQILFEFQQTR